MVISEREVLAFLDAEKAVTRDAAMRWIKRNSNTYIARLPLTYGGVRVGELFLASSSAVERCWKFKVLRQRAEILRWDFAVPPSRHRNPRSCGGRFPRKVRELEHEHLWQPGLNLECASPLADLSDKDHHGALEAFCQRAKIDMQAPYVPPPPMSEQLALG